MVDFTERGFIGYFHSRFGGNNLGKKPSDFSICFQEAIDFFNSEAFYRNFGLDSNFSIYYMGVDGKADIGYLVVEDSNSGNGNVYATRTVYREVAKGLLKAMTSFFRRNGYECETEGLQTHVTVKEKRNPPRYGYTLASRLKPLS